MTAEGRVRMPRSGVVVCLRPGESLNEAEVEALDAYFIALASAGVLSRSLAQHLSAWMAAHGETPDVLAGRIAKDTVGRTSKAAARARLDDLLSGGSLRPGDTSLLFIATGVSGQTWAQRGRGE